MLTWISVAAVSALLLLFIVAAVSARRDMRRNDAQARASAARWARMSDDGRRARRFAARERARGVERREREAAARERERQEALARVRRGRREWLIDLTNDVNDVGGRYRRGQGEM